jgi:hypothetical protein
MNAFMKNTIKDIRGGRESWRVFSLFSASSFFISVATVLVRQPF